MTTYYLLYRAGERERFVKWRFLASLHDHARNATSSRLFPQIPKQLRELLVALGVDDLRSTSRIERVHAHVERAIAHHAETALGVFELP